MRIARTTDFVKKYQKLPQYLQKKVDKQIKFLQENMNHPSLRVKRMQDNSRWEARVDRSYRLTSEKTEDLIILRTLVPHDYGLEEK